MIKPSAKWRCRFGSLLLFAAQAGLASPIDAELAARLEQTPADQELEVLLVYRQLEPASTDQLAALRALGVRRGHHFARLPIAQLQARPDSIRAIAARSDVYALRSERPLQYFDANAEQALGAAAARLPARISGDGIAVLVHDSGIDATRRELAFGGRVLENARPELDLTRANGLRAAVYQLARMNTDSESGHGTHVAGIIVGRGGQSDAPIRGIAREAVLVGYGAGREMTTAEAVGGFDFALQQRERLPVPLRLIVAGWGRAGEFDPGDPVVVASYVAYQHGIATVFAAGNDGPAANTLSLQARAPWVIAVGAADASGGPAAFSARGEPGSGERFTLPDGSTWRASKQPTLIAPGVAIRSSPAHSGGVWPQAPTIDTIARSGSSMAAAHVAGVAALLLQSNRELQPAELKAVLTVSARPIRGRGAEDVGAGRIDALDAVPLAKLVGDGGAVD